MPILESYSADDDRDLESLALNELALEDDLDDFSPERPQRIAVPPIMLWGAMWLVAISVTVAATATLLLPRRLNAPPQRPKPPSPTDIANSPDLPTPSADSEVSKTLPTPPEATPETPLPLIPTTPETQSEAQSSPAPRFPFRLLLGILGGCALTSLTVTLVLRGTTQRSRRQPYAPPPMTNPQPEPVRHPRPRSTVATTVTQPRVMVLPPEVVTPLDGIPPEEEGDLAAQLDIRRRYSLSSLIDDTLD